jgi:LPXTG-motif cell wall-anchored protein
MSLECRRVPSVCRRIVVLLVVALLGVGAPLTATAFAQSGGAGDQQYSDPFGGDDSDAGNGNSDSGSGSGDSGAQPLTQAPQTSGGSNGSSGSGSGSSGSGSSGSSGSAGTSGTSATSTTAPAATGTLPNTGLDARVLVLAGVVLVLVGLGLRFRNAPERF